MLTPDVPACVGWCCLQAKRQQVQTELEAKTAKKRAKRQKKKVRGGLSHEARVYWQGAVVRPAGFLQRSVHAQVTH
jgi:hypothetical protein